MHRRSLLKMAAVATAATAAAGTSGRSAHAATPDTVDVKIDPFRQTEAQKALRQADFPNIDADSYQDFANGFRVFMGRRRASPAARAHTEQFLKAKGFTPTGHTDMDFEQAFDVMMQDPAYAVAIRLERSNQHLMWDRARRHFHRYADRYLTAMEQADKSGPGSLELNPDLNLPDYCRYEIHAQPGGFVGDPFMGWIYHYALRVGFHSDIRPKGEPAPRDNGSDEMYLHLAQALPKPVDGKVRRVLDLGCGTGQYTTSIKERFPRAEVWGIEMGGPMVRYAHYRAVRMNRDINFAQRLAEDTRFPDGHFDIVTDHIMFHEVSAEAAKKIVAETFRILRPGGVFQHCDLVTDGHPKPPSGESSRLYFPSSVPSKAQIWANHRHNIERWLVEYTLSDFPEVLRQAGFDVDLSVPPTRDRYPGVLATRPA